MAFHPTVEQFRKAITEMNRIHEESWVDIPGKSSYGTYNKDKYDSAVEACAIVGLPKELAYLLFLLFDDMNDIQDWAENPDEDLTPSTDDDDQKVVASQMQVETPMMVYIGLFDYKEIAFYYISNNKFPYRDEMKCPTKYLCRGGSWIGHCSENGGGRYKSLAEAKEVAEKQGYTVVVRSGVPEEIKPQARHKQIP